MKEKNRLTMSFPMPDGRRGGEAVSDYCKFPNQCGPGMDCSSCMGQEITRLSEQLQQAEREKGEHAPAGEVVVTKDENGTVVAVTRQDEEGQILSTIWEAPTRPPDYARLAGELEGIARALASGRSVKGPKIVTDLRRIAQEIYPTQDNNND